MERRMLLAVGGMLASFVLLGEAPKPQGGPYIETVNGIEWTYMVTSELKASVGTGTYGGWAVPQTTAGDIAIPTMLGGRTVIGIGDEAFRNCLALTSVTIPETVTSIGAFAFYGCSGLTSVSIPSSVMNIGWGAFSGCKGLGKGIVIVDDCVLTVNGTDYPDAVILPEGVRVIAGGAFSSVWLTSVTIPPSVKSIGSQAFSHCYALTDVYITDVAAWCNIMFEDSTANPLVLSSITFHVNGMPVAYLDIPEGVTGISSYAFYGYDKLSGVTIPSSVTHIGKYSFSECWLTDITIPSSVTIIGEGAFSGCNLLTTVTLSDGLKEIGPCAFYSCGLTSMNVTIPSSVTSICEYAFCSCGSTSIFIPAGVAHIGYSAFAGGAISEILVSPENAHYASRNGVLFNKDMTRLMAYPGEKHGPYTIPPSVVSVDDSVFSFCYWLTSIVIPSGVTSIANGAFSGCYSMSNVVVSPNVTNIGASAFSYCEKLSNMTFRGNAPSVDASSFDDVPKDCTITVFKGTTGWDDDGSGNWQGRPLIWIGLDAAEAEAWIDVVSERYKKEGETALDYRKRFEKKFGNDYAKVSSKLTGKLGTSDAELYVWHDYVAGTDPTDINSVFAANIKMHDDGCIITWQPDLNEGGKKEERTYKIWGSENLADWEWPTNALHRFFKVTVEMP